MMPISAFAKPVSYLGAGIMCALSSISFAMHRAELALRLANETE